jgi:hypothetical protein
MSNARPKKTKPKKQRQKAAEKKPPVSVLAVLLAIATLIGVPAALVAFLPRVTATMSDPLDTNNPFSSSITIVNTGYLPLHAVTVSIAVQNISGNGSVPTVNLRGVPNYGSIIHQQNWVPRELGLDDRFMLALDQFMNFPTKTLGSADIAIVIDYEIPIIHIKRRKRYPYFARKQPSGNFFWYADAPPTTP